MRRLLIVDDERIIRDGLARSLDWHSIGIGSVETASDGQKAYDIIRKAPVDIVVTDIVMPEMDGISLIKRCAQEGLPVQFVILSSYDDFQYAQEAIRSGVCEYVLKPCNPIELKKTLVRLLEKIDSSEQQMKTSEKALNDVKTMLPHAKVQILEELLHAQQPDELRAQSLQKLLHLKSERYCFLFYPLEWHGEKMPGTNSMMEAVERTFPDTVCCVEKNNLMVVSGETSKENSLKLAGFLRQTARENGFTGQTVLLSTPRKLSQLYQCYQKAAALSHLFFYFDNNNLIYMDSVDIQENPDMNSVQGFFPPFTEAMKKARPEQATELVNELFQLFRRERYGFAAVQKICLRLSLITAREKESCEQDSFKNISLISFAENVQSLYDILTQEINQVAVLRRQGMYSALSKPVQITMDYIQSHLDDGELSLSQVAGNVLFINADYLGKLFKKECGIKFSSYLLTMRMDRAKQLLRDTDDTIQKIAAMTGFSNNPSYFSQTFKKCTGMLPKEYRSAARA